MEKEGEKSGNAGGILKGLSNLVDKLGELAETGERLKRSGEVEWTTKEGKPAKGVFGVSIKVGMGERGDEEFKVEHFGNVHRDEVSGKAEIRETREPLVDVFTEADHVLVVAEMPGIGEDDLQVDVKEDILTLTASRGDKRYHKEVLLPARVSEANISASVRNGVVEIRLPLHE